MPKPICLLILDGYGHSDTQSHNAIATANTPNIDRFYQTGTHTLISGSGSDVGLPDGQMGNSEVGHLNIGAGRMVPQNFTRIGIDIESGAFEQNETFTQAIQDSIANNTSLHVFGLLSPGGVHSHEDHILALLAMAHKQGCTKLYLHAFLDGRDTAPQSALASIQKIENQGAATIASICGRYYAMDRDNRWDRIQTAYELLTEGKANHHADTAEKAIQMAYDRGETDEFVQATYIHSENSQAITINDGDSVIFMNFRADRAREITKAFTEENFDGFNRHKTPNLQHFITLTEYHKDFKAEVAYPPLSIKNTLGEYLANNNLNQLRIAETEKYAHVTFFFNGGIEKPNKNEDRILIPSPDVATYDLQPEMSAPELTEKLVAAIESEKYDAIICNYANPDMVGHTGNFNATVKAIETIDTCLEKVVNALTKIGGEAIITADHGNAECMYNDKTEQAHTAHTSEPVPFIYVGRKAEVVKTDGALSDLAPTVLYLMGLDKPEEMTGDSIVKFADANRIPFASV